MRKDFEFLTELASSFFLNKSIRNSLISIYEFDVSGWEKWIQIEFAKFCQSHSEISECGRELRYELDKRISKNKSTCAIDFLIRQKHKHSPMAIEIKQQNSPSGCIKAMLVDFVRLTNIKYSQDDLRGIWCIGVHNFATLDEVKNLVIYHSEKFNVSINKNYIFSMPIGKNNYSLTIF